MSESLWNANEICAVFPHVDVSQDWVATGISIDTRTLAPGDIFIALKGPHNDGHRFIDDALARGAAAVVVSQQPLLPLDCLVISVDDTQAALNQMAIYRRQQCSGKMIALTGSAGKTTTKQFLGQLCQHFGRTSFSQASLNNHWGVPLSLARMPRETEFGIFEIGMNHPGEISPLTQMVQPHVAMITNIGDAHIGLMGSRYAIAMEKTEIFTSFDGLGVAVVNADDHFCELMCERALSHGYKEVLTFGRNDRSTFQIQNLISHVAEEKTDLDFVHNGQRYHFTLPFLGEHRATNALGCVAALSALGLSITDICQHLSTVTLAKGRGGIHHLRYRDGMITLIDDAYNANPASMRAALAVLASMPKVNHRYLVAFGEMGELGDYSVRSHIELATLVQALDVDLAFSCGHYMLYFHETLPEYLQGSYGETVEDILPPLEAKIRPGDILLVKGSKYTKVSKIIDYFLNKYPPVGEGAQ